MPALISNIKSSRNDHANDLNLSGQLVKLVMMLLTFGLVVTNSQAAATRANSLAGRAAHSSAARLVVVPSSTSEPAAGTFSRRSAAAHHPFGATTMSLNHRHPDGQESMSADEAGQASYHRSPAYGRQSPSQDLASADQLDEPTFTSSLDQAAAAADHDRVDEPTMLDNFSDTNYELGRRRRPQQRAAHQHHRDNNDNDETIDISRESPSGRDALMSNHNSQLRAMRDMFERRHLDHNANNVNTNNNNRHHARAQQAANGTPLQSSQELSPIAIGLDPGSPFSMPPLGPMGPNEGPAQPPMGVHFKPPMSNADNLDGALGPALPFGLNPLPHLLGFQSSAFDGPQRGDQSAHSNHHAAAAPQPEAEMSGGGGGSGQKTWPKIFRFTDGRINLSDFEKQKKIRLSNKNQHGENHIESAPIMFDGRQLKRKSFLILHGGVFPGN
jgi:hypothetical protein